MDVKFISCVFVGWLWFSFGESMPLSLLGVVFFYFATSDILELAIMAVQYNFVHVIFGGVYI